MNRLFTFACFCTCSVASWAAPIDYVFNFTVTGGLNDVKILPSGQFTYDPAIPAFSNFFVSWNSASLNFDLTSAANNPSNQGCTSGLTGAAAAFNFLSTGEGGDCGDTGWLGETFPGPMGSKQSSFRISGSTGGSFISLNDSSGLAFLSRAQSFGEFTISAPTSPVPEPASLTLLPLGPHRVGDGQAPPASSGGRRCGGILIVGNGGGVGHSPETKK